MKRTVAAWLAGLTCAVLAACTATTSGHAGTPALDPSAARHIYLQTTRPLFPGGSVDDELLRLGHSVCNQFDDGGDWLHVLRALLDGGLKAKTSGELIAAAVATMCPDHLDQLPGGSKFSH